MTTDAGADLLTRFRSFEDGCDLELDGFGLTRDDGLTTAVILSLFSDARARADDELPAGETERRGWWGDVAPLWPRHQLGSRLWLLHREKQTNSVLERARQYAEEALAWMLGAGVAKAVRVEATAPRRGLLWLRVEIERPGADVRRWQFAWDAQAQGAS